MIPFLQTPKIFRKTGYAINPDPEPLEHISVNRDYLKVIWFSLVVIGTGLLQPCGGFVDASCERWGSEGYDFTKSKEVKEANFSVIKQN